MGRFIIGTTDFGIDTAQSSFELSNNDSRLDISIHGDQEKFEAISSNEDSEWFWALYPPKFYFNGSGLIGRYAGDDWSVQFETIDGTSIEAAIYMMNHNDIYDVIILISMNRLVVTGLVDLMGDPMDFRIDWTR